MLPESPLRIFKLEILLKIYLFSHLRFIKPKKKLFKFLILIY